jgi:hypothetical protein
MMTSDLKPARRARRSAHWKSSKSVTSTKTTNRRKFVRGPRLIISFSHPQLPGHAPFRISMVTVAEEKKDEDSVQITVNDGGGRRSSSTSKRASTSSRSTSNRRASSSSSTSNKKTKDDALAHLVRYETMVRQQEAEDMATLAYMRPCLERLVQLAEISDAPSTATNAAAGGRMDRTLSFRSLRAAREKLDAIERDPHRQTEEKEFLATDRQLLMVLRILTKDDGGDDASQHSSDETTLTWAEFVQCYKVCIAGMLTLQQLAAPGGPAALTKGGADNNNTNSDAYSDSLSLASLRSRTRDRTVSMMSLFGPSSTEMLNSSAKKAASLSRRKATASAASRAFWFALKAGAMILLFMVSLIGASWMYHYANHGAAMRGRNKPPRFVPLTSLYPPHFYNTSPMTTASTRSGEIPTLVPSSSGHHPHSAFPARTPPFYPKGIAPVSRAAARIFYAQDQQPLPSGAVANRDNHSNRPHQLTVWQLAIGGAVALPLTTQLLFPPAVAGRFVATASLLMVAAVGAATNVLATLCARALERVRQLLARAPPSSPAHP